MLDSAGIDEYRECIGKADFLGVLDKDLALIESVLMRKKKYFFLNRHINRLKKSAEFFGIKIDMKKVRQGLKREQSGPESRGKRKVRILVFVDGRVSVKGTAVRDFGGPERKITVSAKKTDSKNPFIYHKTTHRELYDSEYEKYSGRGYYDVIFTNESGEVTEAHSSNIIIEKGGYFFTPPVCSGLLAGTYRDYLMNKRPFLLKEKVLYPCDLKKADAVYLCNSVRGLRKVIF